MQKINLGQKVVLVIVVMGFIGVNFLIALLRSFDGIRTNGVDNMNDYYDVSLKEY